MKFLEYFTHEINTTQQPNFRFLKDISSSRKLGTSEEQKDYSTTFD